VKQVGHFSEHDCRWELPVADRRRRKHVETNHRESGGLDPKHERRRSRKTDSEMTRRLAAIVLLCAAGGISLAIWVRASRPKLSAQDLLREAARDGGPLEQIFGQQAGQGYYGDALATARLATAGLPNQGYELSGYIEQLIRMRAENGDIQGAKEMAKQFTGSALTGRGHDLAMEIAKIQVDSGDLHEALATCTSPEDTSEVMEEYGSRQILNGDFDGALKTAEQVDERSAYNLFYAAGSALYQRGEQRRLHELASHMADKKRAAEFVQAARVTLSPNIEVRKFQATPCEVAVFDANSGKFAEAWTLVDQNNCPYSSFIAIKQYASDPAEAERELRKRTDKLDVSHGMAEMGHAAAKKGDIPNARRLFAAARQLCGDQDYCLDYAREMAWAWTLEGKPNAVLRWARSLPKGRERGYALLGIAQAMGHARPN